MSDTATAATTAAQGAAALDERVHVNFKTDREQAERLVGKCAQIGLDRSKLIRWCIDRALPFADERIVQEPDYALRRRRAA
ncbi:MAG TPA: hypothetical protein VNM48_18380 [Chloroflexota bacterium]|nr:hypothetical protein [Chloroflexota bacterium]